jgi:hypothetical protein
LSQGPKVLIQRRSFRFGTDRFPRQALSLPGPSPVKRAINEDKPSNPDL